MIERNTDAATLKLANHVRRQRIAEIFAVDDHTHVDPTTLRSQQRCTDVGSVEVEARDEH